jgi:hypothetical protein
MKLAIVGSRTFNDYGLLVSSIKDIPDVTEIVSGGARGADKLAERYAKEKNIPIKIFLPEWDLLGKSAGYIRNKQIVDYCDKVLAFWDGISKGTNHSIKIAENQKKDCIVKLF